MRTLGAKLVPAVTYDCRVDIGFELLISDLPSDRCCTVPDHVLE